MIKYYVEGEHSPQTATDGSAGLDLFVNNISNDQLTLGTGVHVEIPEGFVGLVLPRSSWGLKGFQLSNTCGVIDSDYRGEIKLARDIHPTKGHLRIKVGDRVAQMIVVPCMTVAYEVPQLSDLTSTERGDGGFGSTGGV